MPTRHWYYPGTSGKRWESIQRYCGFLVLPIYLTTDRRRAEHYAQARAASDGDGSYAVVGLCLPPDKVAVDAYSTQEPDQFILTRSVHASTFYSRYLRVDVAPMPTGDGILIRLKAFAVGMDYGEPRRLAPRFQHLAKEG